MRFDRKDMRKILEVLRDEYPENVPARKVATETGGNENEVRVNCYYLSQIGLVELTPHPRPGRPDRIHDFGFANITAQGIDFLLDDGGLSAILGVVTVKLHEDTIRELLLGGVAASSAPEAQKSALREAIKKAPGTAFTAVIQGLIGVAMAKGPEAIGYLASYFGV